MVNRISIGGMLGARFVRCGMSYKSRFVLRMNATLPCRPGATYISAAPRGLHTSYRVRGVRHKRRYCFALRTLRTSHSAFRLLNCRFLLIYRSCSQINSSPRTAIEGMGRRAWRLHTPRRDFIQQSSFWLQVFSIPQLAGFLHIGWLFTALHDLQTEETLVALPDDQGCCHHRRHR